VGRVLGDAVRDRGDPAGNGIDLYANLPAG
jgi:hypothetical protein